MSTLSGKKILVVDDDATIRDSMSFLLEAMGAEVTAKPDFESALAGLCAGERYDAALIDNNIGEGHLTGLQALPQLKQAAPEMKIAMLSGDRIEAAALSAGADAFLTKPARFDAIAAKLSALLIPPSSSLSCGDHDGTVNTSQDKTPPR